MNTSKTSRGHKAELYACAYLRRMGYVLHARNYQYRGGELDIVAQTKNHIWVFVEVKSVWHPHMGNPNRRVGFRKQDRVWRTAVHFLHHHGGQDQESRLDVIAVDFRKGAPQIQHILHAFEGKQSLAYC
jgi:putative endonuclease